MRREHTMTIAESLKEKIRSRIREIMELSNASDFANSQFVSLRVDDILIDFTSEEN